MLSDNVNISTTICSIINSVFNIDAFKYLDTVFVGNAFLYLLLLTSFIQIFSPRKWIRLIISLNIISFYLCVGAFATLIYAFVVSDFSVANVFFNSNTLKPFVYKVSAAWASHEGSMLMWTTMISLYSFIFTLLFAKEKGFSIAYHNTKIRVLIGSIKIMGFFVFLFGLFLLLTSNPFKRISPVPFDGLGLNPMLQDPALAIHPPLLYMGYIGCIVPFAIMIAFVISLNYKKQLPLDYLYGLLNVSIKIVYKWFLIDWAFLTAGIFLGSFWAYYELGWGGYWSWDPVENASLLPWLMLSISIHFTRKLSITNTLYNADFYNIRNKLSKLYLLSVIPFILSITGTLIVRSGFIESIHSFAVSSERGAGIVVILALAVILGFYGLGRLLRLLDNVDVKKSSNMNMGTSNFLTREWLISVQNAAIVLIFIFVLIGIFAPTIYEYLYGISISLDQRYFLFTIAPVVVLLLLLMGGVNYFKWFKGARYNDLKLSISLLLLSIIAYLIYLNLYHDFYIMDIMIVISAWVIISIISKFNRASLASNLAHIGIAICVIGISINSRLSKEAMYEAKPGQYINFKGYKINFEKIESIAKDNYISEKAILKVLRKDNLVGYLAPENRYYPVKDNIHSETSLLPVDFYLSNLYVVMDRFSQKDNSNNSLKQNAKIMQLYYHAFINLLWLGGALIVIAIIIALYNNKKRKIRKSKNA